MLQMPKSPSTYWALFLVVGDARCKTLLFTPGCPGLWISEIFPNVAATYTFMGLISYILADRGQQFSTFLVSKLPYILKNVQEPKDLLFIQIVFIDT